MKKAYAKNIPINTRGFTIVELLIVIVVIAILATISIVAYNGIQARTNDSQRLSDIASLNKALELYYINEGQYPPGSWAYSDTASWDTLLSHLAPYASSLTKEDPTNTRVIGGTTASAQTAYIYSYYTNTAGSTATPGYCGATAPRQMYIITYRLEATDRKTESVGTCDSSALQYAQSWFRSVKN